MASLWAQERVAKLISEWSDDPGRPIEDLIAEAIDAAEEYGEARFRGIQHEPEKETG